MCPPHSVNTWPTPACFRVLATSCPPVRSAMAPSGPRSAGPESRDDLGGDRLELGAFVSRIADRAHDEVAAPGGAEILELLGALLGRPDDAVALGEGLEVLRVALAQHAHPRALGRLVVAADREEDEVRRRELRHRPAGLRRRGADLVEALSVAVGLHDVGHPAVTLTTGAGQRRVRAAADPDRRRLLHGLGIDRDRVEAREAPVEAGGRIAPECPHRVDAFVDPGAPLLVGDAAELELLRVLAADADAEYQPAAREHVERGRLLGRYRRRA